MIEAALRTNASPTAIWVLIVVVMACLAFWLIAVTIASHSTWSPHASPGVRTGVEAWGAASVPRQAPRPASQQTPYGSAAPDLPAQRTGYADQPARTETNTDGASGG
jgi:hypothetical protein